MLTDYTYPTPATLQKRLGVSLAVAKRLRAALVETPGNSVSKLNAAGDVLESTGRRDLQFYGVERIDRGHGVRRSFYYTNTGDSYSPVIAYFPHSKRFIPYSGGWAAASGLDR